MGNERAKGHMYRFLSSFYPPPPTLFLLSPFITLPMAAIWKSELENQFKLLKLKGVEPPNGLIAMV